MAATVRRAAGAEAAVVGQAWSEATLNAAQAALAQDFKPLTDMRASAAYRAQVAQNLLRRFWLQTRSAAPLDAAALSVWSVMPHAPRDLAAEAEPAMNKALDPGLLRSPDAPFADHLKNAAQRLDARAEAGAERAGARVGISRPHESAHLHVAGAAPYVDDIPELAGTLHAALGLSPVAHGRLTAMHLDRIRALARRRRRCCRRPTFPARTIAARSIHDDPILADGEVRYVGQPVFLVVATTRDAARRAAAQAKAVLEIEPLPAIFTPEAAHRAGAYVLPPMHLARGDARAAIDAAPHRLHGRFDVGGQEQFYLEGQISYAIPQENDGLLIHCSTQHPSEMQHLVAHALGLQSHHVQVVSAGAWAAASAARSRSPRCSPAPPRSPRRSCGDPSSCASTATTISSSPAGATASGTSTRPATTTPAACSASS